MRSKIVHWVSRARSHQGEAAPNPRRGVSASEVNEHNVYFAFPNGRLTYDCVSCNATCCRGHGYLLGKPSESDTHLHYRPNLHLFAEPADETSLDTFVSVKNCPPACFFLTQGGQCGIQIDHGYTAKPEACRLFPFNNFCRVGNHLVVSPHPALCPLGVTPFGTIDAKSRHEVLLREIQLRGISGPVPTFHLEDGISADALLMLEREIRQYSEEAAESSDYTQFAAAQLDLSLGLRGLPAHFREEMERRKSVQALQEFLGRASGLLQASFPDDKLRRSEVTAVMVAATSQLRAQFLFHAARMGPREHTCSMLMRLPYLMLSLFVFAMAAQAAGMTSVTLQTLQHLSKSNLALLRMISSSGRVLVWKPGIAIPTSFPGGGDFQRSYFGIAKALLASAQRARLRSLVDIISECCAFQGVERVRFLTMLSRILTDRVVSMPEAKIAQTRLWKRVRCVVQRSALALAGVERLSSAASKQTGR